jgi:glycosyltransferase involved in cell wall biosynthesis
VVSTPKGAEGLGCVSGEHLVLAEPDEFAVAIIRLADDPSARERVGRNGWELVKTQFDWPSVSHPRWRAVLHRWLPDEAPSRETP